MKVATTEFNTVIPSTELHLNRYHSFGGVNSGQTKLKQIRKRNIFETHLINYSYCDIYFQI